MTTTAHTQPVIGRAAASRPRRWVRVAALLAMVAAIPSSVWRLVMLAGALPGTEDLRDSLAGQHAYVIGLSVVELTVAAAVLGLAFDVYRPLVSRRLVPAWLPPVVGVAGGLALTWLFSLEMPWKILAGGRPDQGLVHGSAVGLMIATYVPVMVWGPLTIATSIGAFPGTRSRAAR